MSRLPIWARVYVVAVIAVGGALFGAFVTLPRFGELHVFLGLVAATMAASTLKLELPSLRNRASMSASFVIDFASLLLLGPHKTMLVASIGVIGQSTIRVTHRNPVHRILTSVASLIISSAGFGPGGTSRPPSSFPSSRRWG